jgi:hypothetical protein
VFTPELGEAARASWPWSRSSVTSFEPMRPLPPMTTSFNDEPFLCAVGRETGLCAVGRAPGPRAAVTDRRRSRGSRRIALGWASSPVVHRTLCWPCSSVASAQRASRL